MPTARTSTRTSFTRRAPSRSTSRRPASTLPHARRSSGWWATLASGFSSRGGAGPFDVKATGVDFAACSTFKWLMGDFGIGFLYAREDLLDRIRRPVMGYYQAPNLEQFFPPNMPDAED